MGSLIFYIKKKYSKWKNQKFWDYHWKLSLCGPSAPPNHRGSRLFSSHAGSPQGAWWVSVARVHQRTFSPSEDLAMRSKPLFFQEMEKEIELLIYCVRFYYSYYYRNSKVPLLDPARAVLSAVCRMERQSLFQIAYKWCARQETLKWFSSKVPDCYRW